MKIKKMGIVVFILALIIGRMHCAVFALPVQWQGNGHYYDLVAGYGNWTAIIDAVNTNYVYEGMNGYLATITSEGENQFITSLFANQSDVHMVFLGGTKDSYGKWIWDNGPESGLLFWDEAINSGPLYANWGLNQPDRPDVHYLAMCLETGAWYDVNNGGYTGAPLRVNGYIVEYSPVVPEPDILILLAMGLLFVFRFYSIDAG